MSAANAVRPSRPSRSSSSAPNSRKDSRSSSSIPSARRNIRSSASLAKTEVIINVYDLLPTGTISSVLWPLGMSLLHTGVVLNNREYAYGATSKGASQTGIFWTRPRVEPPGARFRCSILQGFTYITPKEIEKKLLDATKEFPGNEYNLLVNNCNHFTDYICRQLTSREAPSWLNRASKFGVLFPCVVPKDWITPPEVDVHADEWNGEAEDTAGESSSMLQSYRREHTGNTDVESNNDRVRRSGESRDVEGRGLPASEVAASESLI